MSITVKLIRDFNDLGYNTTRGSKITLEEGVTILIGCNGIGKSTLLRNIEYNLKGEKNIKILKFDGERQDSRSALSSAVYNSNFELASSLMQSSEGENLVTRFGIFASTIGNTIRKSNGYKKLAILIDAVDSGLSVDNIYELGELFKLIIEDLKKRNIEAYIVVSANNYTTTEIGKTLNTVTGNYIKIKGYKDYVKFILNTKKIKDKRYDNV